MIKEILATYLFTKLLGKERTKKLGAMAQKNTTKTAAIILGFIAIAHSIRFAFGVDANVAGWTVPLWFSLIATIIAGYLAFSLWKIK